MSQLSHGCICPSETPGGEGELVTEMSAEILPYSRETQRCPRDPHGSGPSDSPEFLVLPMGFLWDPSLAPGTPLKFWSFPWDPSSATEHL